MSLPSGWLYQSTPYFSEETNEWVIANGTSVVVDGETRGVLYFELRLEALRAQVLEREGDATMRAITARNGTGGHRQPHDPGLRGHLRPDRRHHVRR